MGKIQKLGKSISHELRKRNIGKHSKICFSLLAQHRNKSMFMKNGCEKSKLSWLELILQPQSKQNLLGGRDILLSILFGKIERE